MGSTAFGLALLVGRLERERSADACVRVAEALGYGLAVEPGSMHLEGPRSRFLSVYFQLDALVDDVLAAGRSALGWKS